MTRKKATVIAMVLGALLGGGFGWCQANGESWVGHTYGVLMFATLIAVIAGGAIAEELL